MILSLHIENMAVISSLDLELSGGLNAITGETGSGKSVMIDCLLFLLGGKPARELLRSGEEKGIVSAVFGDIGEECAAYLASIGFDATDEIMLQRTLTADGKTQCRLNGRAVTQAILRDAARYLVSVHGQNDNQILLDRAEEAKILDSVASFGAEYEAYRRAYRERNGKLAELSGVRKDDAEKNRLRDILKFQISEIDAAKLKDGEEEELFARRTKLQNAEKITKYTEFAYRVLYGSEKGVVPLLERAAQSLSQLSGVMPEADELSGKLMNMRYEAEDVAETARAFCEEGEGDPTEALNRVESRLDAIAKLRRKYGADVAEILAFRKDAAGRLSALENSEEEVARLEKEIAALEADMRLYADVLHKARADAARDLAGRVREGLRFLDMPSVAFDIPVKQSEKFGPTGCDDVEFSIATNPGEPLMPLSKIASGGELARVMLALKSVLNERDGVGTAVFDEVDTGISGKTSRKIGIKLSEIGKHTQVISVTHSAQIASLSTSHLKISKKEENGRAYSAVSKLSEEERVTEVARILGGLLVTDAQRAAAKDMIEEGKAYR